MAKKDLGKMSDEEYKLLSQEDLMRYNKTMPQIDYEQPYQYQEYPLVMYQLVTEAGSDQPRVRTALVKNEKDKLALGEGWKRTIKELGIETCPGAAPIAIDDSFAVALQRPQAEPTVLTHLSERTDTTLHLPKGKNAAART